ncbi:uncharacterized protein LOC117173053 [Belonocnema kinseyi]|uniref:uncharacterized protein LOC117173053 n=1 Tax=Belonocnema kinseyi TaxID=2817044 RepID=UPI00143DEC62|nr:uncharacterized protein LOC117173053 [Belonocnema kinseyi]
MGGHRCLVPNCKSGYDPNKEKTHHFSVPYKETDLLLQWERAIPRKDYVLKAGMVVCHKHFLSEDIVWRREVLDPDGNVMASEDLKRPYLRKGAIPSQFPNCPAYLSKAKRKRKPPKQRLPLAEAAEPISKKIKVESESTLTDQASTENSNILNISDSILTGDLNLIQSTKTEVDSFLQEDSNNPNEKTTDPEDAGEPAVSEKPLDPETVRMNLFTSLFLAKEDIKMSLSWCRRQTYKYVPCIELSQCQARLVKGRMKFVTTKQITISSYMRIGAEVLGIPLPLDKLGLAETYVSSTNELEMLMRNFESLKVCSGFAIASIDSVKNVANSFVIRDPAGYLRHLKCSLVIPISTKSLSCEICTSGKRILSEKIRRLQKRSEQ